MYERIADLKGKFIVSCQSLETEPLHLPFIMGRIARAVMKGGAGIRLIGREYRGNQEIY